MNNSARQITIALGGYQFYLLPSDLSRPGIEWIGTVQRGHGDIGALGRITATGLLVQVNAGSTRTLDQHKAKAALRIAEEAHAKEA